MRRPRKTTDDATLAKLDRLVTRIRREAEIAEVDPFDDAMVAAVVGGVEALQAEAAAMAELEGRWAALGRRALDTQR